MRFLLFLATSMACLPLLAQPLLFENYTSEQGLSQNSCYAIAQDGYGFMWFGTQDGLNRYDGREFRIYSQQNEIGRKLPSNIITTLHYDKDNDLLWIGTVHGACIYHPRADTLMRISDYFPLAARLENVSIRKIISFRPNEYWVITFNHGLILLNTASKKLHTFFNEESERNNVTAIVEHQGKLLVSLLYSIYELLPLSDSYSFKALHKGYLFPQIKELYSYQETLWIGTMAEGCYYIKGAVDQRENISVLKPVLGGIGGFTADERGNLWIGTRGSGLYRYHVASNSVDRAVQNQYDPSTPCSNYAASVFTDRQDLVWIGYYGGISKFDPLRYQFQHIDDKSSWRGSLVDKVVTRIFHSRRGNTYVGTMNKGMLEWDRERNAFTRFPETETYGIANNVIYDFAEDNKGELWVASCGGLMHVNPQSKAVRYYSEKSLPELNKMYAIIKLARKDSLLIATENGLRYFSLKDRRWHLLPDNVKLKTFIGGQFVYTGRFFYEAEDNTVWLCTEGSGLVKYRYLTNEFEEVDPVNRISLFIRHLFRDGDLFWLATDNGVVVYDPRQNKVLKHINLLLNGTSNVAYAVEKDDMGYFWVSSNTGIFKFNDHYELVQKYETGNGLSFLEYNTACVLRDTKGTLYFGGMGGITGFRPSVLRHNDYCPQPMLTSIHINGKGWYPGMHPGLVERLSLSHNENYLTIGFAVNNFSNETNNRFSYVLKGLDEDRTVYTSDPTASFTSLPPGDYIFELRAANSDGVWSSGVKKIFISILAPWWHRWWFIALVGVLVLSLASWLIHRHIQKIRREAGLQQQLAELEMKSLHAQMNPHFIFNCLNSIKEMIFKDQKQSASRYLSKFAQLIRTSLDQSQQTFISIEQCVEHLRQYLEMEQIRFEDFSYSIEVDEDLIEDKMQIAPMLVQPLVENAVWHGLRNKQGDRKLQIRFRHVQGRLVCEVEDNGPGIHRIKRSESGLFPPHKSFGIANIQERLALLNEKYAMQSSLEIRDKSDEKPANETGTLAILELTV